MDQKNEITKLDLHYEKVCREILRTQGIVIKGKDLQAHNIFSEHQKNSQRTQLKAMIKKAEMKFDPNKDNKDKNALMNSVKK